MTLSFETDFGTFRIKPTSADGDVYGLNLVSQRGEMRLGEFRSINNAILAVVQQKTGFAGWDALCLNDVPYRVFDITCWDFYDFSGTNATHTCSQ